MVRTLQQTTEFWRIQLPRRRDSVAEFARIQIALAKGSAVRVYVESLFDCPAKSAWQEVQKTSLLLEIAWPLARIRPVEDLRRFPERRRKLERRSNAAAGFWESSRLAGGGSIFVCIDPTRSTRC